MNQLKQLSAQDLGRMFNASADNSTESAQSVDWHSLNERQQRRRLEKGRARVWKRMGPQPDYSELLESNIPNPIGRNLRDKDGYADSHKARQMGSHGAINSVKTRAEKLRQRVLQLLKDDVVARCWCNPAKKGRSLRRKPIGIDKALNERRGASLIGISRNPFQYGDDHVGESDKQLFADISRNKMSLKRTQRSVLRLGDRPCSQQFRPDRTRRQVASRSFDQRAKSNVTIRKWQFLRRATPINEF